MSLRGLWGFNTLPGKACDVENILLCLHFKSQTGSVLESGGHYTLQGHLTPLPPVAGSSLHPSILPATDQENPEKSISLASPLREAAAGNQEGA